jgi:uncharacterized protein involved in exopolysaccharide biosynthesis
MEDMKPQWSDVWNVAGGAMKMQMTMWTGWKIVAALGVAGALAAGVAAFTMQPVYQSSGLLRVTPVARAAFPDEGTDLAMAETLERLRNGTLSRSSFQKIIAEENLYQVQTKTTMYDAVAQMQRDVVIRPVLPPGGGRAELFLISFRYPDAATAQRVTNTLISQMVDNNVIAGFQGEMPCLFAVLDAPRAPNAPVFPNRPLMIVAGLTTGLLLGSIAALMRRRPVAGGGA